MDLSIREIIERRLSDYRQKASSYYTDYERSHDELYLRMSADYDLKADAISTLILDLQDRGLY